MSVDEIRRGMCLKGILSLKLGAVLIITGLMMIMIALIVELVLATTVGDYIPSPRPPETPLQRGTVSCGTLG